MKTIWKWLKRGVVGVYAAIAGLFGGGGSVIADRRDMYGDEPTNDTLLDQIRSFTSALSG